MFLLCRIYSKVLGIRLNLNFLNFNKEMIICSMKLLNKGAVDCPHILKILAKSDFPNSFYNN